MATLTVTAEQADREARGYLRKMNAGRIVPKLPKMLEAVSKEKKVYLFNVGPWPHERHLGSLGPFFIPACEKGKEYSAPLAIPGIVVEPYPENERKMALHQEEGQYIAEQILGVGPHLAKNNSFVKFGVFISQTEKPSKADLEKARAALRDYYQELVREANSAHAQGPKTKEETIQEKHFLAARELDYSEAECPWLKDAQAPAARDRCEGCGTVYTVGVIVCPTCRFILDPEKYEKNKARFAKQ